MAVLGLSPPVTPPASLSFFTSSEHMEVEEVEDGSVNGLTYQANQSHFDFSLKVNMSRLLRLSVRILPFYAAFLRIPFSTMRDPSWGFPKVRNKPQ